MITTKDPSLTVYPDRQQMLALIRAQAAAGTDDSADERRLAEPEPPGPTCIFLLVD